MARKGKLREATTVASIERPPRSRKYTYYILIVCEDESTEPDYFARYKQRFLDILPKETVYLRPIGSGRNSLGVVEYAKFQRDKLFKESGKEIDQTWAVFDKDDLDKTKGNRENFEKAFCEASASNIKIAYSNECFELWFLLHFEDVDATEPLPRKSIYKRLEDAIKRKVDPDFEYEHGDTSIVDIIWQNGDQKEAIIRAKGLNKHHSGHQTEPIDANPNTLVYKLVEELESWYAYYVY